jgi:hypothetical protein
MVHQADPPRSGTDCLSQTSEGFAQLVPLLVDHILHILAALF